MRVAPDCKNNHGNVVPCVDVQPVAAILTTRVLLVPDFYTSGDKRLPNVQPGRSCMLSPQSDLASHLTVAILHNKCVTCSPHLGLETDNTDHLINQHWLRLGCCLRCNACEPRWSELEVGQNSRLFRRLRLAE